MTNQATYPRYKPIAKVTKSHHLKFFPFEIDAIIFFECSGNATRCTPFNNAAQPSNVTNPIQSADHVLIVKTCKIPINKEIKPDMNIKPSSFAIEMSFFILFAFIKNASEIMTKYKDQAFARNKVISIQAMD